jgi:hypothetical protein
VDSGVRVRTGGGSSSSSKRRQQWARTGVRTAHGCIDVCFSAPTQPTRAHLVLLWLLQALQQRDCVVGVRDGIAGQVIAQ